MNKVLLWILYLPVNLLVSLTVPFTALLALILFSSEDKKSLEYMKFLETIDNDLSGDEGWKAEHLIGTNPLSFINRYRWLLRNGGNRFNYNVLGCAERPFSTSNFITINDEGYWLYRKPIWITNSRFIDVFLGWSLRGPKLGKCKYVCTIRLKTKP